MNLPGDKVPGAKERRQLLAFDFLLKSSTRKKRDKKMLQDKDPFPFGKYRGVAMEKVPADYLDWVVGQTWIDKWPAVVEYVERNRKLIDEELEDMGKLD